MAELNAAANGRWTAQQSAGQFRAIGYLRWRMLLNGLRTKRGASTIALWVLVYPTMAVLMLAPTMGAGAAAWYFAAHGHAARVNWLLWAVFVLAQMISLNVGRPGTNFNPNELIRFPMKLRRFVLMRLFFGTISPANIVAAAMSMAIFVGVTIAEPRLWAYALVAMAVFAAMNVLFNRMIFAWVDRWLSTRRAREIFTALIFVLSMGFQYVNVTMNPAYNRHRHGRQTWAQTHTKTVAAIRFAKRVHPMLAFLPPELTGKALAAADHGDALVYVAGVLGTGLYAALFLSVFALRIRAEFHGEVLTDVANAVATEPERRGRVALPETGGVGEAARGYSGRETVVTILRKELVYVRRNTGLFYSLVVPALMVLLFASRSSARAGGAWVLPAATAYALFSVLPMSYNIFGLEGAGIQLYFLTPVRLRDVFLAKNLMNMFLAAVEVVCVVALLRYLRGPQSMEMLVFCVLWGIGALLVGMTIGNVRSITAPMRVDFTRAATKQAAPLNAFMSMGVLLGFAAIGAGLIFMAYTLHAEWMLLPAFSAIAVAGFGVYVFGLRRVERIALEHRENLYAVLSKQG